jgi:hypothetical protein
MIEMSTQIISFVFMMIVITACAILDHRERFKIEWKEEP